jgi:glyoxylase-like metal-dependent hydrolase (beta-lactamase superfamily II)
MLTRLTEGIWWFDLQGVNAYLVEDDDALTLVDAGMPWHHHRIVRGITTVAGSLSAVDRILVTHYDIDHVGGLDRLGPLDATVYVGVDDEPYLSGRRRPDWRNRKGAFQRAADLVRGTPTLPVETVADGETVGAFTAYGTPGHTPGHTSFVHEDLSAAFLGDLVRETGGRFERPPWFLNYDHDRAGESIVAFADSAPDCGVACQGHGTPCTEGGSNRVAACAATIAAAPE